MKNYVKNFRLKKAGLVLGVALLTGCASTNNNSNDKVVINESIVKEDESYEDRYALDYKKAFINPIFDDEEWDHVILSQREVRHYTDGTTGYSDWECLGEYYLKNVNAIESLAQYKVEKIDKINLYSSITSILGNNDVKLFYIGDSKLSLDSLSVFKASTRNYIAGNYTEFTSDGNVYFTDDDLIQNDLIDLELIDFEDVKKKIYSND